MSLKVTTEAALLQLLIDAATMSPQTQWIFNKVDQMCCFVLAPKLYNIQVSAVGSVYIVASILTNCHTCLTGSSHMFIGMPNLIL